MQTRIKPILKDYCMGEGVTAFSTTRQCGYSKGNYASFNINCYCGDEEEAIKKNRFIMVSLVGLWRKVRKKACKSEAILED